MLIRMCWLFVAYAVWMSIVIPRAAMGAGEDADLELIPSEAAPGAVKDVKEPERLADGSSRVKIYIDDALERDFRRAGLLVPLPDSRATDWKNRLSIDGRAEVKLLPTLTFTLADRLNYFTNIIKDDYEDKVQNDLKEIYLTWNVHKTDFIEIGRVNVKDGVAMGFNPTDFFKKNAVRSRVSEDLSVLRENRLGTLSARAQGIWEKGAISLLYSPKVSGDPGKWWTQSTGASLGLDRTNSSNRYLAKLSVNAWQDINPELLYFNEDGNSSYGVNLTKGVGDNIVTYLEWSGSSRPDLISQALQGNDENRIRNQLAVGFSYSEKINRTTCFEYHYNEAGLSAKQWQDWFDSGARAAGMLNDPATMPVGKGLLGQLWSIRGFAQEAQEPLGRHYLFIRSNWQDAFVKKLDLTGILKINLLDGSFFVQPMGEYHLSNTMTLTLAFDFFVGPDRSEFGSLQQWGNVKAGFTYYL